MRHLLILGWGLSITAGALWIRFAAPQQESPLLDALVASEPFHVFAHAVLYGALAWLCTRRLPLLWVVPAVLALALVQELAQVVGERTFGGPELFDLAVDAVAAVAVVGFQRWGAAPRPGSPTSHPPPGGGTPTSPPGS